MSEPSVVAVMGSCITRDNFNTRFNPDYKSWFAIGPCTNQSSMIALLAPPVDMPWAPIVDMAKYGLWNVASDLNREIVGLLEEAQPAYLVLDFFGDVHFGILETADGRIVTNNRWKLHKTDLYQRLLDIPGTREIRWEDDPDEFMELWRRAIDQFAELIATISPRTTVIVHRGFNTDQQVDHEAGDVKQHGNRAHGLWLRKANRIWAQMNEYASAKPGWENIHLGPEWWITDQEHPWGAHDVHYTMDYYPRFLAELHAIHLKHTLPVDEAAVVDEVRLAARQRVRGELVFWRGIRTELEGRQQETSWIRRLRNRRAPDLGRPELTAGKDHQLVESLRGRLSAEDFERLQRVPASADVHVEWLRSIWRPRMEQLIADVRRPRVAAPPAAVDETAAPDVDPDARR